VLSLGAGCFQEKSNSPEPGATSLNIQTQQAVVAESPSEQAPEQAADDQASATPEDNTDPNTSSAAVAVISTPDFFPEGIHPASPLAEMIKLAEAGMEEGVMVAYVTNSMSTFNLRPEDIIYLNDIGMPSSVVTAMMKRDHMLQGVFSQASNEETEPAAVAPKSIEPPQSYPYQFADNSVPTAGAQPEDAPPSQEEPVETAPMEFDDALAPYGTWINVGGYGACWQPTVAVINHGWQPYFNSGCWVYTDHGWYWKSGYSWGWAAFHYGRWFRHSTLGWCWAPGKVWGPAWVTWRWSRSYCGWAPLPPAAVFKTGSGLTFHGHRAGSSADFNLTAGSYKFVDFQHLQAQHLSQHALPHDQVNRIFGQTVVSTRIAGNDRTVINNGLPPERLAEATHKEVQKVSLHPVAFSNAYQNNKERIDASGKTMTIVGPMPPQPAKQPGLAIHTHDLQRKPSQPALSTTAQAALVQQQTFEGTLQPHQPALGHSANLEDARPTRTQPVTVIHNSRDRTRKDNPALANRTGTEVANRVQPDTAVPRQFDADDSRNTASRRGPGSPLILRGPDRNTAIGSVARQPTLQSAFRQQPQRQPEPDDQVVAPVPAPQPPPAQRQYVPPVFAAPNTQVTRQEPPPRPNPEPAISHQQHTQVQAPAQSHAAPPAPAPAPAHSAAPSQSSSDRGGGRPGR
jgi:hypothetical protein